MTSLVAQTVECLSTMWETRVRSLGHEDPLEKKMAPHSSTIAWKIPWTEEPGRLQSMESQRVRHDWVTYFHNLYFSPPSPPTLSPNKYTLLKCHRASLVAQMVKCLPAMLETWVWSLGWEDPLEKEMSTYSSILAWKIPWMEEPGRLQSTWLQRVGHNWSTS